ncbi:Chaperone DnaJ-domain superfamily protein [Euphorbia peplus]|nr:Chaperone DnaJ-domain superfamily protein [Euphorbia peplus]
MRGSEARELLGFPPNSRPTSDQVKAAYKKKVWKSHPDLFPSHEKPRAESRFKLISEAYTYLLSGASGGERSASASANYAWVVRSGTPRTNAGRSNHVLIKIPFLFIILGTIGLGSLNATRAYRKQKEAYPSHNPFLP